MRPIHWPREIAILLAARALGSAFSSLLKHEKFPATLLIVLSGAIGGFAGAWISASIRTLRNPEIRETRHQPVAQAAYIAALVGSVGGIAGPAVGHNSVLLHALLTCLSSLPVGLTLGYWIPGRIPEA